jgi:glutamate 5-kinase
MSQVVGQVGSQVVVVKIGTSSITDDAGSLSLGMIENITGQVALLRGDGHRVVVVSSGAVAAGLAALKMERPRANDVLTKQAVSAVGQSRLMRAWDDSFSSVGLVSGQALMTPNDFFDRTQYLHARNTFQRLLELGVVPVVNENDALADDELRFGDNDRIAALVAHLVSADVMVLLTDINGLYTDDPRTNPAATLISSLPGVTAEVEALAGGTGSAQGSGGMRSKIHAAKMASLSGIRAVIANATRSDVLIEAVNGGAVGTTVEASERGLSARKLWIGFAVDPQGTLVVDAGAQDALVNRNVSLLPAGVVRVTGDFEDGAAVNIANADGSIFARGLVRFSSRAAAQAVGKRSADLPEDAPSVMVHRDDLVVIS